MLQGKLERAYRERLVKAMLVARVHNRINYVKGVCKSRFENLQFAKQNVTCVTQNHNHEFGEMLSRLRASEDVLLKTINKRTVPMNIHIKI